MHASKGDSQAWTWGWGQYRFLQTSGSLKYGIEKYVLYIYIYTLSWGEMVGPSRGHEMCGSSISLPSPSLPNSQTFHQRGQFQHYISRRLCWGMFRNMHFFLINSDISWSSSVGLLKDQLLLIMYFIYKTRT